MPYIFGLRPTGITTHDQGATLPYRLAGEWDSVVAREYAIANTPATFAIFFRRDLRMTGLGGGIWDIDVEYATAQVAQQAAPVSGTYKWTFDTTGQTKHITQAIEHIMSYVPAGGTVSPHGGAIGVTESSVEGVDVPDRGFRWTETWQLPLGNYGFFYGTILGELTGRVNASYFRGFPAYTVRFDGAAGGQSTKDDTLMEITFSFAVSPSEANIIVDTITVVSKIGWDHASVCRRPADHAASSTTPPKAYQVDVDRVFTSFNFSLLGIGTGILT